MSRGVGRIRRRLDSYPHISRYLIPLGEQRSRFPEPESSALIRLLEVGQDDHLGDVETQLRRGARVHNFSAIFDDPLGSNPDPDEKIFDIFAEVRVAELLSDYFDDVWKVSPPRVAVQPRTCDFIAGRQGERTPIEVKDLGGVDFKGMKPVGPGLGYSLSDVSVDGLRANENIMQDALLARVRKAETQIKSQQELDSNLGRGVVAIVDRRAEGWLFKNARGRTFERLDSECDSQVVRCVVLTTQAGPEFEVFPGKEYSWFAR